jgi:hypothetical protein
MDFTLYEVIFGKVDMCHHRRALANVVLIPSHASRVQHVQISEYLLIRNCMVVKSLHQFFYYHNKYLNSMKCWQISMGPSKCTNQCRSIVQCALGRQHFKRISLKGLKGVCPIWVAKRTVLVYFQHLLPSIGSSYTKTITMYAIGIFFSRML